MASSRIPSDQTPNDWTRLLVERRAAGADLLDLSEANPTRVGLGGAGPAELAALSASGAARYEPDPRGSLTARAAVSAVYAARGLEVPPGRLVLTAGTSEAYAHLFRLLGDPGDLFLAPVPSYPLFEPLAAAEGVRIAGYRLGWDGGWHLDAASLEAGLAAGARAVVVVQPNHPTGSCLDPKEIGTLTGLCAEHGAAIVSDEVFLDFPWPSSRRPAGRGGPLPSLAGEDRALTFVLGGLSKSCGMPQMKLGWIAVSGPGPARDEALRGLEWLADLFLSVSGPVQAALPRLLEARQAFQSGMGRRLARNLDLLAAFAARRPEVDLLRSDGGWSALLRLPARRTGEAWSLELLRRDVVVHPGHFYDVPGEAWLVPSLVPRPEVIGEGLARLEALLEES